MKNSLFRKILAVGATLALVSSFFVVVPVSAAPGCNAWGDIDMPDFAPNTELGVMDIAPDGTIFLAVWTHPEPVFDNEGKVPTGDDTADGYWQVKYSTDGGFTWKNTNMPKVYDNDPWRTEGDADTFTGAMPTSIKVSPMWPNNKNVYVALTDGTVWRLPNAGLGTPAPLRTITDEQSQNLGVAEENSTFLWDMDIWADGTYNYLAVATDLDVFVIKDQLLEEWVDYQLNVVPNNDARIARQVRFAPDFATSELIWAVVAGDDQAHNDALGTLIDDQLYLVSADSPARWGYVFDSVGFTYYNIAGNAMDTRFVDIAFDPDYTSALPQLYVSIASDNPFATGSTPAERIEAASKIGNLWFVSGEAKSTGPGEMDSGYIFFEDQALGSVQVSGSTIMVQNVWTGDVYTTTDRGNTWPVAKRSPAGKYWGHLLMSPNYATDATVYSTSFDGGWSVGTTEGWGIPRGGISGVYRSTDGGVFFDGISLLDMPKTAYSIVDLAFDPKGGSQPVLMVINSGTGASAADYLFYTADATAAKVQWLMKDCMTNIKKGNDPLDAINLISWDEAGDVVMLMGLIDSNYYVFRSYDEGNSFAYWRLMPVATVGVPADWVVVDNNTISVAGASGYWGTRAIGTEIKVNLGTAAASIARQGDNIAIGTKVGSVRYSSDAGKTWDLAVGVGGSSADTFVAFASDGTVYAAAGGGSVTSIVVGKAADGVTDALVTTGKSPIAAKNGKLNLSAVTGIWVSPDNTLYVMGSPVSVGTGLRVANNTKITLDATPPLSTPPTYTAYKSPAPADAKIWVSEISIVAGDIEVGDEVEFYSADVKTYSSSTASGYIWVVAFDDDDNIKGIGEFEIVINDADNPFAMFEKWPADLNVSFDPFDVAAVASTAGSTSVSRLLLGEKDNVWEQKIKDGVGLWGTTGSNLVWTVEGNGIAALEDFNSGAVQNVTVQEVDKNATKAEKSLEVSWSALPCTSCYEIYVYVGDNLVDIVEVAKAPTTGFFDGGTTLSTKLTDMDYATKYDVQVRACEGARLQSRLSAKVSATTECYNVAPTPQVPVQGMQDASLAPSFVWAAPTAGCAPVKYDFQLSTDPNFGSFIIDTTVTGTGYTYTARDLAYDTDHYWRVRSVAADGTKSNWTTIQNFHTMLEPKDPIEITQTSTPAPTLTVSIPPVVTVPPAQTITVSVPPAVTLTQTVTSVPTPTITMPDQPTPAYIWVIVAVGAILTIAVIVLIIRTRRAE